MSLLFYNLCPFLSFNQLYITSIETYLWEGFEQNEKIIACAWSVNSNGIGTCCPMLRSFGFFASLFRTASSASFIMPWD